MTRHIILLGFFAWGHLRPELNLAVNIARKIPDVSISVIADASFQINAQDEVDRVVYENEKDVLKRIRVIAAGRALAGITPEIMADLGRFDPRTFRIPSSQFTQDVQAVFHHVMKGESFQDDNGVLWDGISQKPSLLITDMFMADVAAPMRELYQLKTYMYWISFSAALTRAFGPLAFGGQAQGFLEECHAIEADPARKKGRSFVEIATQMNIHSGRYPGGIVRVKGMKPFYEWENVPVERPWSAAGYWAMASVYPFVNICDGLLLPTVLTLDAEGTDGVKEWFCANTSRPVFSLGPQLPASYLNAKGGDRFEEPPTSRSEVRISYFNSQETAGDKSDTSIIFLNNALKKYGAKSVLYITFGSLMVPELARVGYLLDVLLELEEPMPFLFTTASTAMHISDSIREKVATTGRGLLVPWAPQQAVLEHPATGWAVSHCGAGGITESLAQGIPLIAWPVGAEQPSNARWVSEVLDTAFELLQVRARLGHNKAFRGGPNGTEIVGTEEAIKAEMKDVLTRARGEEGRRKRANAGKVQQLIREALVPGGQVDEHFELLNKEIM